MGKFTKALKANPFLIIESLFRWPSREIKDSILNNYEDQTESWERKLKEQEDMEEDLIKFRAENSDLDEKEMAK